MKQRKPVLNFKCGNSKCSQVLWAPNTNGLNIVTCLDDDYNSVVQTWDLRKYNTPTHTLRGHTGVYIEKDEERERERERERKEEIFVA